MTQEFSGEQVRMGVAAKYVVVAAIETINSRGDPAIHLEVEEEVKFAILEMDHVGT